MHKIKAKAKASHSSQRALPLKDSDYDHEINLVDNSAPVPVRIDSCESDGLSPRAFAPTTEAGPSSDPPWPPLLEGSQSKNTTGGTEGNGHGTEASVAEGPRVSINDATPFDPSAQPDTSQKKKNNNSTLQKDEDNTAIDILWENERGGFLCGIALFSSKALGNLDPPAWTNVAHKPSATNTTTAQVPDPSWEWAWPEWRINHDDGVDAAGWEYSFMFSRKFSWHGPTWWNSFVRRRAWIRKRVRKDPANVSSDPHLLNPEYFTIRPSSEITRDGRRSSRVESQLGSKASKTSMSLAGAMDVDGTDKPVIESMDALLQVLKASSIDREKIEAVQSYLEHDKDGLAHFQDEMHEIMSLFVFQASRRILLTQLREAFEQTERQRKDKDSEELKQRESHLNEAVKHADEELRQLEYWSDVKGAVEAGDSRGAVDEHQGWEEEWRGVDQSGPSAPAEPRTKDNSSG